MIRIIGIVSGRRLFHQKIQHKSVHALTIFQIGGSGLGVAIVRRQFKKAMRINGSILEIPDIPQFTELVVIWKKGNRKTPC